MNQANDSILVTGAAGFIGFHVSRLLCARGRRVVGVDNLNSFYDVTLKEARLARLEGLPGFSFTRLDITEAAALADLMAREKISHVVHLAAQAGVRHSLTHPFDYSKNNIEGFLSVLEACRANSVKHLVYASSSSIYGANGRQPFSEHDASVHPVSLYAATKRANELMAHTYSHLFALPATGLRFFTVYGPWGRPDMALFLFTRAILAGEPIDVFNHGEMQRDFTYIDDIAEGVVRVLDVVPGGDAAWDAMAPDPASSHAPWRIFNIGNNRPVELMRFVRAVEAATGKSAKINMKPLQPGDVPATLASVEDLAAATGFAPSMEVEEGVARFVAWYRDYYQV
ncbi:MAG: NAD-dependent epimerase [Rhodobiaceae bacterium]|nr:NAD-dependent epimerase [Rhodobiaceae bacterium]